MTRDKILELTRLAIIRSPALQVLMTMDSRLLNSEIIFAGLANMFAFGVKAGMEEALGMDGEADDDTGTTH